jgi:hypothetical protein
MTALPPGETAEQDGHFRPAPGPRASGSLPLVLIGATPTTTARRPDRNPDRLFG